MSKKKTSLDRLVFFIGIYFNLACITIPDMLPSTMLALMNLIPSSHITPNTANTVADIERCNPAYLAWFLTSSLKSVTPYVHSSNLTIKNQSVKIY